MYPNLTIGILLRFRKFAFNYNKALYLNCKVNIRLKTNDMESAFFKELNEFRQSNKKEFERLGISNDIHATIQIYNSYKNLEHLKNVERLLVQVSNNIKNLQNGIDQITVNTAMY